MNTLTLPFFMIPLILFSQENNSHFMVNKDVLLHLTESKPVTTIYRVKTIQKTISTTRQIEKKSEKYSMLKKQIADLTAEKKRIDVINLEKQKVVDEINSVQKNIQAFLDSKQSYPTKKHFLKKAQTTAFKHNIKKLIYADSKYNTANKSKFVVFSLSPIELKIYLRNVLKSLPKPTVKLEKFDTTRLVILEKEFADTKPTYFITVKGKPKVIRKKFSSEKVNNVALLNGKFKKVNDCSVVLKDKKGMLKKDEIINNLHLDDLEIANHHLKHSELDLIKHLETNEEYIVDNHFLKNYGTQID